MSAGVVIEEKYRTLFRTAVNSLQSWFRDNVKTPCTFNNMLPPGKQPSEWDEVDNSLAELAAFTTKQSLVIPETWLPLLKRVFIHFRRSESKRIRSLQGLTHHLELLNALDAELADLDHFVQAEWFRRTSVYQLPRLTDVLPIAEIESQSAEKPQLQNRVFDEKFHLLQAPQLFLPDLGYYRTMTDLRDTSTTVAFVDIDNFKKVNSAHTETFVDRTILPPFMRYIEAAIKFHGYAYRQGGDEYMLLVPGLSKRLAIEFLDDIRTGIEQLEYRGIDTKLTVSIGACVADANCYLADRELQQMANAAKDYAKEQGKNRVATYKNDIFSREFLEVVRPR